MAAGNDVEIFSEGEFPRNGAGEKLTHDPPLGVGGDEDDGLHGWR
jgi:hypothetical protein